MVQKSIQFRDESGKFIGVKPTFSVHSIATDQQIQAFWNLVNHDGPIPEYAPHLGQCWIYTGHTNSKGYAQPTIGLRNLGTRRKIPAHRLAWELSNSPVPKGLELDHLCRVPSCVRPAHLEPVTHRENLRRSPQLWLKPRCPYGHPYSGENLIIHRRASGIVSRDCRECKRLRRSTEEYKLKRREQRRKHKEQSLRAEDK